MTTTISALTIRRAQAEAAVAEAKVAARAVLDFAPGPDTKAVAAARLAATHAARLALAMIETWAEEERDRAEAALYEERDATDADCRAILAFEF
ncbi:hypothetical protein [Methylobacterium sp. J-090]|uniref:hypothetical protein n=1 Tax=Methylobacterium sp. J-090 TaxID=2836666 RepID=UPI001FBB5501|nr:hypothetical protein [Methylobacterium sp. J-090]MCJ2081550.1 hypothetical protein [Methylobacterium sp. J-090]